MSEAARNRMNFITMCVNSYPNHTVTQEQLEAIERLAKMVYPDNNEKKQP